jgi:hypothetical protein
MSDYDYADDEVSKRLSEWFNKHNSEYLKFERIPVDEDYCCKKDLSAFNYLHRRFGGGENIIDGAGHDVIYLSVKGLSKLTEFDVLYLTRCGVLYDQELDSLFMFV